MRNVHALWRQVVGGVHPKERVSPFPKPAKHRVVERAPRRPVEMLPGRGWLGGAAGTPSPGNVAAQVTSVYPFPTQIWNIGGGGAFGMPSTPAFGSTSAFGCGRGGGAFGQPSALGSSQPAFTSGGAAPGGGAFSSTPGCGAFGAAVAAGGGFGAAAAGSGVGFGAVAAAGGGGFGATAAAIPAFTNAPAPAFAAPRAFGGYRG